MYLCVMGHPFKITRFLIFLLSSWCFFSITSCTRPDVGLINKDIGVEIPQNYELVKADSDPFGLGADADQTFVFQFDSVSCLQLEKAIKNTPVYNIADVKQFDSLGVAKKLEILRTLADNKLTAYWVRSGAIYWFDGDSLFLNTHDNIIKQLFRNKIVLPNREAKGNYRGEDGISIYNVQAILDTKKRTLFYRYIHI